MDRLDLGPRYHILRQIGKGGMGLVFLVEDSYLEKKLALKLLSSLPGGAEEVEALKREFAVLAEIEHPGIARAHDFGFIQGRPYFTSEYISGKPLKIMGAIKNLQEAIRWLVEIAEAVSFLHRNEILHLDIKPSNIIIPGDRSKGPVLIDFGLFRRGGAVPAGEKIKGSLPFMAPEYFNGGPLGPWTDVFALGVTFYHALTGSYPYPGAVKKLLKDSAKDGWDTAPRHPSSLRADLPGDLGNILLKCVAFNLGSRYPSGRELLGALEPVARYAGAGERPAACAAPAVGRNAELAEADRFLEGLLKGKEAPRVLLITGLPGMGQSHLLREIKVRAQTRGFQFFLETGYPGRSTPPGSILRCLGGSLSQNSVKARGRWHAFLHRIKEPQNLLQNETLDGERRLRRREELRSAAAAIRDPMILAVDGLQYWDEVSLELFTDLVRFLKDPGAEDRPPLGVVAGYREEGPFLPFLMELTENFLNADHPAREAPVITLRPLGLKETAALYERLSGKELEPARKLSIFQKTGGSPSKIALLIHDPAGGGTNAKLPASTSKGETRRAESEDLCLLLTLSLLKRPATAAELSLFLGIPRSRIHALLRRLEEREQAVEEGGDPGRPRWLPGPGAYLLFSGIGEEERRQFHRLIAETLAGNASGRDDPRLLEAVRHFLAAGCSSKIMQYGRPAARYLKATFQNRAALNLYRQVLDCLPRRCLYPRLEAVLEMAELHALVGDLDEGIRILRDLLRSRKLPAASRIRAQLHLATLYSRRGEFRRAEPLFQKGLRRGREVLAGREKFRFLSFLYEHAAMKCFQGDYPGALKLFEEGLNISKRSRGPRLRAAAFNLHAIKANIALRTFKLEEAIRHFETALQMAETGGSLGNRAVILNNLGIAYSQTDHYQEAIRAYQEAEKTCLKLDEGPSLASIYGNLAILHAKTGDFEKMEKSLKNGETLLAGSIGKKQEFFLKHSRGLGLIHAGRFREARACLEEAARLGDEIGDRHVALFDKVYRAEALLFEGAYGRADLELSRVAAGDHPERMRKMALSRHALLAALMAQEDLLEECAVRYASLNQDPAVPYLEAWDKLFLGWAYSIGGQMEKASKLLSPAESFFQRHGLNPGSALIPWVRAEGLMLAGEPEKARMALETGPASRNGLLSVIRPLLAARILLETAREVGDLARCADLLAEAGAALVGNPMLEWNARLEALRSLLNREEKVAGVKDWRKEMAGELPERVQAGYWKSRHFQAWTSGFQISPVLARPSRRRGRSTAQVTYFENSSQSAKNFRSWIAGEAPALGSKSSIQKTATIIRAGQSSSRALLTVRSAPMRHLVSILDRLKGSDLPVLIGGETGTGKELVARILHQESRRAEKAFKVVDCAAVPPGLFEVELFGAKAGAYTGLEEGRAGILELAGGGTVLFDEVAGLPLESQAKLLRALSENSIRPLGAESERALDARFIFSTSCDLDLEVKEGRFRKDLFHRINVMPVIMPPLRERSADLPVLAEMFLSEGTGPHPALSAGALKRLSALPWPGNVREFKNFLLRLRIENPRHISAEAVSRALDGPRGEAHFPQNLLSTGNLDALKDRLEKEFILHHFRRLQGDTPALCRLL
ncbi:MAG: sigma 54-interacting transcriptional regulator, partial [Planctomycetes bacterium]|nr:sigma 54-interacting transcriptional regulator [Planctomycetota bacterium]